MCNWRNLRRVMSFRGGSRFAGRASASPSQIFKKRNDLINVTVPSNSNATLLGTIAIDETGTLYAVTVDIHGAHLSGAAGDNQRLTIWVRCVASGAALQDLTLNAVMDTTNGFSPCVLHMVSGLLEAPSSFFAGKFRYRRKCDAGVQVELIAQSTNIGGTGRSVQVSGHFGAVVRVR